MKYVIEFDLPDNDTVLNNIKTAWVGWNVWGYSGCAHAKPKQPERKKGKWIRNDNGTWSCDQCQSWIPDEQHYYANWCLFCGSDMRGRQE